MLESSIHEGQAQSQSLAKLLATRTMLEVLRMCF